MPLYISVMLKLPEKLAGVLMGTATGLEIPVMLLAGHYAKRVGKRNLMLIALAAAILSVLRCAGDVCLSDRTDGADGAAAV